MTNEELAAMAERLTEAHRYYLTSVMVPWENRMGGYGSDSGLPGMVERVGITHPIFGSHYRLTPLGQQVRSYLIDQENRRG